MSALLLNEQTWLTLLYLVVLPLLMVGVAVASFRGRARRRARGPGPPQTGAFPEDPTPMAVSLPPSSAHSSLGGERIVALGGPVPAPSTGEGKRELDARVDTLRAELEAARRTIERQDRELTGVRAELLDACTELEDRERVVQGLRSDLSRRREGVERLPVLMRELEQLRAQVADLLAEREFLRSDTGSFRPPTLLEEPGEDDPLDDHLDDDEIVVPMPASAADEFDLAPQEEAAGALATGARGRQLRRVERALGDVDLRTATLDAQSMVFDGTTTPVAVASGYVGLSAGSWTVEAWVKPVCTRLGRALISYAVAGSTRVAITAGGPRPSLGVEVDGKLLPEEMEPRLLEQTWQHVAVAWDGFDGRLTIYLGGALAYSGELSPEARVPAGGRLLVGQQFARGQQVYLPARAFEGALAEVRVWSHVRSPSGIRRDTHRQPDHEAGATFWRVG